MMILRDGTNPSIWQETTDAYTITNNVRDSDYDVIIIGGGMTGITTALRLQLAGKKCLLLESNTIGFGTTSGTTAHLNTMLDTPYSSIIKNFDVDKARLVSRAVADAIGFIKYNIACYTIDCAFEDCDAYLFALDERQAKELDEIFKASKEVGLPVSYSDKIPLPIPFIKAMSVTGQAKFNPMIYLNALAAVFEMNGGTIKEHCRVTSIKEEDRTTVESTDENFTCAYVVYATHIPPTVNPLHLECIPYRSYAMAFRLGDSNYPTDLAYDMNEPYRYYRSQTIDGIEYLIAGGEDHKTGHDNNTSARFMALETYLRKYFNIGEITQRWSSQYYESKDGLPYIGKLPGHAENILVATGFGGNGMVYSQVAARIIGNIILEKEDELNHAFLPSRIKPLTGLKNFISHNVDVIKNFGEKMFEATKINGLADLAPGEGKIVALDGHHAGVYKDDKGVLYAVNTTCTHLGCSVKWNVTEKSWDCPCHGARYSPDGKVLNGPAVKDLEYIQLETMVNSSE